MPPKPARPETSKRSLEGSGTAVKGAYVPELVLRSGTPLAPVWLSLSDHVPVAEPVGVSFIVKGSQKCVPPFMPEKEPMRVPERPSVAAFNVMLIVRPVIMQVRQSLL